MIVGISKPGPPARGECQCAAFGQFRCGAPATAEDLLCDDCRSQCPLREPMADGTLLSGHRVVGRVDSYDFQFSPAGVRETGPRGGNASP